jgi:membrane protein implicated in regulation of membrane protease activity
MDGPFAWQNVIFLIPIAFGLLMFLGAAFGSIEGHGHDSDAGHGHGHDGDKDAGKDAGKGSKGSNPLDATAAETHGFNPLGSFLDLLGFGRVPLTLILAIAGLTFGGTGYVGNILLAGTGLDPAYFAWVTIPLAFVSMTFLTGGIARGLNRIMPSSESYNVTQHDLVGQLGTLVLPADATRGLAQVKDRQGNVFNVTCRTDGPELQSGQEVLVIEYVVDKDSFLVQAYSSEKNDVA